MTELTTIAEIRRLMLKADPFKSHIVRCDSDLLIREMTSRCRCIVVERIGCRLRLYLQDVGFISPGVKITWIGPIPNKEILAKKKELGIRLSPYVDYLNVERVRELIRWEQGGNMPEWVPSREGRP